MFVTRVFFCLNTIVRKGDFSQIYYQWHNTNQIHCSLPNCKKKQVKSIINIAIKKDYLQGILGKLLPPVSVAELSRQTTLGTNNIIIKFSYMNQGIYYEFMKYDIRKYNWKYCKVDDELKLGWTRYMNQEISKFIWTYKYLAKFVGKKLTSNNKFYNKEDIT